MIQTITLAALLVAGSLATTASLLNDPMTTGLGAIEASASDHVTRRGTREPLVITAQAEPVPALRPRRGARAELVVSEAAPLEDGLGVRRGVR